MPSDGMMRAAGSNLESSWLETHRRAAIGPRTAALRQVPASRPSHAPLVSAWRNVNALYSRHLLLALDSTPPVTFVGTRTHLIIALFHTRTHPLVAMSGEHPAPTSPGSSHGRIFVLWPARISSYTQDNA
ncbi:hypothetical protein B0H14DRAFT_3539985 [Mycena olivaceomarginata]|nr:hypothetical protein B0H14DRAFT_3539985 [Mycena olivaceomarginata]